MKLVLATHSRLREEAFKKLGLPFEVKTYSIDEQKTEHTKSVIDLVKYLARLKVAAIAKEYDESIVLGFDSVAVYQKTILRKPSSLQEARGRLYQLSDQLIHFYTGVYAFNTQNHSRQERMSHTKAQLRTIKPQEISEALEEKLSPLTFTLGFNPLVGIGTSFLSKIEGDHNNILYEMPLAQLPHLLKQVGYPYKEMFDEYNPKRSSAEQLDLFRQHKR